MKPFVLLGLVGAGLGLAYLALGGPAKGAVGTTVRVPRAVLTDAVLGQMEKLTSTMLPPPGAGVVQNLLVSVTSVSGEMLTGTITGVEMACGDLRFCNPGMGLLVAQVPATVVATFSRNQILP